MSLSLSSDQYSGTVAGVEVSYNAQTLEKLRQEGNLEIKRLLEAFAVQAAHQRDLKDIQIQ